MAAPALNAFLDTHAAVFLWEGRSDVWGPASRKVLEGSALLVSPVVRLELALLREVGKLSVDPDEIVSGLARSCGVCLSDDPVREIVSLGMGLDWTRDPFDRFIVATAMRHRAVLVTRDRRILDHFTGAVW